MEIQTTGITKLKSPKVVIYGQNGLGKSSLAASAKNPIFINVEDRLSHLAVKAGPLVKDHADISTQLNWLLKEKHDFKTVVLDTGDKAEMLYIDFLVEEYGASSISDPFCKPFAFGGAKKLIQTWWNREILQKLTRLNNERGMMPVIVCHFQSKFKDDPQFGQYQKYELNLFATDQLTTSWADLVGFLDQKTAVVPRSTTAGDKSSYITGTGQRVLRVTPQIFWEAKESYGLPSNIDLPEDQPGWPIISDLIVKGIKKKQGTGNLAEAKTDREARKVAL